MMHRGVMGAPIYLNLQTWVKNIIPGKETSMKASRDAKQPRGNRARQFTIN